MRHPDRPGAGSSDGYRDSLAERLARLPDRHPSSPQAQSRELRSPDDGITEDAQDPAQAEDAAPAQGETLSPEGTALSPEGTAGHQPPGHRRAAGSGPAFAPLGDGSRAGHDPYRPWFADRGPGQQPWFAAEPGGLDLGDLDLGDLDPGDLDPGDLDPGGA